MQLVNHNDKDATVQTYHSRIEYQGTPQFECLGTVKLADLEYGKGFAPTQGNADALMVKCPNCDSTASVPLAGGSEAQKLHSRKRLADPTHPATTLPAAIESVLADVLKAGGTPSIELAREGIALTGGAPTTKHPQLSAAKAAFDRASAQAVEFVKAQEAAPAQPSLADALLALPDDAKRAIAQLLGVSA